MAQVASHYDTGGKLLPGILAGIQSIGKTTDTVTISDLAPADEFHSGGKDTAAKLFEALGLKSADRVLDVGAGLGGPARHAAAEYGCEVVGIDLTPDFVEAGNAISAFGGVGLADKVTLVVGDALDLQLEDCSVDNAYMLHVGMNIEDKLALAKEIYRVLKPGGRFAVFDPMLADASVQLEQLEYPLPFASTPADAAGLTTAGSYITSFQEAGFTTIIQEDWLQIVLDVYGRIAAEGKPSALNLGLTMGGNASVKGGNLMKSMKAGRATLVSIVWSKPSDSSL